MSAALAPLKDAKTILLTTYKRDGTAVGTPVSIAFDGDRAFFRSYDKAWRPGDCGATLACKLLRRPFAAGPQARLSVLARLCWRARKRASPQRLWRDATASCRQSSSLLLTASCATTPCTTNSGLTLGKAPGLAP